jgi:hypothetical protein
MAKRDMASLVKLVPLFNPVAAVTDNTAQVSAIIDTAGFNSVTLGIQTGTLSDADATFTVLVEHGDASNLSDNAAVADDYLIGTEAGASFTFANDNVTRKIGYVGSKRYVRMTVTPANNTGNLFLAGIAILGDPALAPVA